LSPALAFALIAAACPAQSSQPAQAARPSALQHHAENVERIGQVGGVT
jgi:hypothetical protein